MRLFLMVTIMLGLAGTGGIAYGDSNAVASGTEKVTSAPFDALRYGTKALNSPVNEVANLAIMVTDGARGAVVKTALNGGQPVED